MSQRPQRRLRDRISSALGTENGILMVDEDQVLLEQLSISLQADGSTVFTASSGDAALNLLDGTGINIVITEWMIPGMSAPELCHRIRTEVTDRYVYIVVLTAKTDGADLVEGFAAGADDYVVKPVNVDQLLARIKAGRRVLELERQLEARNRHVEDALAALTAAHDRMRADLEAAADALTRLLPAPGEIGGVSFAWLFAPSAFIGGDGLNVLHTPGSDTVVFYQIDVAGHGVPAALASFMLQSLLNGTALRDLSQPQAAGTDAWSRQPVAVVQELNRRFVASAETTPYVTMIYGILDLHTGRGEFVQAGHPTPLIWRRASGRIDAAGDGGFPVGLFEDARFDAYPFQLEAGDRLILHSDGVTECQGREGEPFGDAGLQTFLEREGARPITEVMSCLGTALRALRGGGDFADDVSVLILERTATGAG